MLFCRTYIFLLFYFFLSCNALQCTTNCSFTFKLTAPFNIPNQCNQMVSAGKCLARIVIWYNRGEYEVSLHTNPSNTTIVTDNKRNALLHISTNSNFFAYFIDRECKNKDDCARDLAKNTTIEMLQRKYNYSNIINEVQPLVSGPSLISANPNLNCYDSNQNERQCGTSARPGSCVISNEMSKKKISVECDIELAVGNAYISIYQSDGDIARFEVHCNRSLCNSQSTLQKAKELMFKYNITITLDGRLIPDERLNGSQLIISSISLMIMMIFILFSNQF